MIIREEKAEDRENIRKINIEAFETSAEANLVDALRDSGAPLISLVAEERGKVVGYILFSPVLLAGSKRPVRIVGLAPMAVLPGWQNKCIGSKLVKEGLQVCETVGYEAVVVLGHPDYYPRFSFEPSINHGIKSEYDVPPEAFMVKELTKGTLKGISGTIKYHQAFNDL